MAFVLLAGADCSRHTQQSAAQIPKDSAAATTATTTTVRPASFGGTAPSAAGATGSASPVRIGRRAAPPARSRDSASPDGVSSASTGAADSPDVARSAANGPGGGPATVNRFLSYDAATKTVNIKLYAALNSAQGGFNFNGGSSGNQTITVPANWTVNIDFYNVDAIPHSAVLIADQTPIPSEATNPAIPLAYTNHLTDGLAPQTGHDTMNFKAAPAGNYLMACGVPGHAVSGMYIRFVVSTTAPTPSNTGTIAP